MTKVIITAEQAKAMDFITRFIVTDNNYNSLIEKKCGGYTHPDTKALNEVNHIDFVRALDHGYEIEQPKFEVGDIVISDITKNVYKVIENVDSNNIKVKVLINKMYYSLPETTNIASKDVRHATKEEIFWVEIGREVREFRIGDGLRFSKGNIFLVLETEVAKEIYLKGKLKGFYPAESFKPFPTGND